MQTEDEDEDISERFHNLLDRYHQMLLNSGHRCGKCRQRIRGTFSRGHDQNHFIDGEEWTDGDDTFQDKVCYDCLKPFCDNPNCSFVFAPNVEKITAENVFQYQPVMPVRTICVLSVGL